MCIARISPSCLRQGRGKREEEERFRKDDFNCVSKSSHKRSVIPRAESSFSSSGTRSQEFADKKRGNRSAKLKQFKLPYLSAYSHTFAFIFDAVSFGSNSGWEDCSSWTWHSGLSWQESYSQVVIQSSLSHAIQSSLSHGFLQG